MYIPSALATWDFVRALHDVYGRLSTRERFGSNITVTFGFGDPDRDNDNTRNLAARDGSATPLWHLTIHKQESGRVT